MKLFLFVVPLFVVGAHGHHPKDFDISNVLTDAPSVGQPWPMPHHYTASDTFFTLDPNNFTFVIQNKCDLLSNAAKRYKRIIFMKECASNSVYQSKSKSYIVHPDALGHFFNITVQVTGPCETYPYMDMNEQYILKINDVDLPNQAILFSSTVWGALRGLETFSQIVYQPEPGVFAVNTTSILDFPRFSYRGILLDTSRHFVPLPVILQNLDAMEQVKMNVFHWHIVDDQSFPYVSKTFPDMSQKGAFNPSTHIYSQKDVAFVIDYARQRGIRVLPEFDTPGHTLSWGKSQPKLLTVCYDKKGQANGNYGPINPTVNNTFEFLTTFFDEISSVFHDEYIHLGGDEVDFSCWKSNPSVRDFMKKHKFGDDYAKLEEYYMQNLLNIIKGLDKSYIVWQEVFDNNVQVKPNTVIHIWKDGYKSELANVTKAGFKTILSSCWYLNYISYGSDWTQYYICDPQEFDGSGEQKSLVIGGEACMWGEYVDGSNLLARTWPRAAAVAERLWSNELVNSTKAAAPRLEELRCNMIKRGLKVEPVNGPGFCECDYLI